METATDAIEDLQGVAERLTSAVDIIARKLIQRTEEAAELQKSAQAKDVRAVKRLIGRAASDLDEYE